MIDSDNLFENGYLELFTQDSDFYSIVNSLGNIQPSRINGPDIDLIKPKTKLEAHRYSLSANFGIGSLPFHTDGAYFRIPPKFIILRCLEIPDSESTPTLLIDPCKELDQNMIDWLKYETWKVKSRTGIFYTSVLNNNLCNNDIIRYDPVCMSPAYNIKADQELMTLFNNCTKTTISWEINKTIILNNWRILHSRPEVEIHEAKNRTLQRAMII